MTWLVAVLLSTFFFAWVSVLDKKLVTDLFPDVRDFYLVFGLMQLVIGPAFIVVALAPAAVFTLLLAFSLGTVSLVSVVSASRPLLVLALSVALSTRWWDVLHEPLDRETVGLKAVSTVMIVGGVVALAS